MPARQDGRGHRFAAYPWCSTDRLRWRIGPRPARRNECRLIGSGIVTNPNDPTDQSDVASERPLAPWVALGCLFWSIAAALALLTWYGAMLRESFDSFFRRLGLR
jgi:hypothetical protein